MNRLVTIPVVWCLAVTAYADSPTAPAAAGSEFSWRSLLGEQLWSDVVVHRDWRIQRHELSGRHRLLDPADSTRMAGTEEQCRVELARLKRFGYLQPLRGAAVVTLHGYGRSRDHMRSIGQKLAEDDKFTWISVNYASTRAGLDGHAATLASVIAGLEGIDEIHFVCHSLGNLVVRRYLFEATALEPRWQLDPRIRRMVMLGPPNQGAKAAELIADILHENLLARLIAGPSAWQLARQWETASQELATPGFEFGIIAGGTGDGRGLNLLLPGDDDLVVCVDETRLTGAADFRVVPCRHGRMMRDPTIQQATLRFLEQGCFSLPEERQPILADE